MKVVEIVKIGSELLKILSKNEVMLQDWKHVAMYEQYAHLRRQRIKYREVIRLLSEEYGVSRATVERVVKRLGKEVEK